MVESLSLQTRKMSLSAAVAWGIFLFIVGYAILTPWIIPVDPLTTDFSMADLPPGSEAIFGTDSEGHNLFVRVAQGLRISLVISLITAISSSVFGVILGTMAGMSGGWADRIIMRLTDGINALPHLLIGIFIVALFKGSVIAIIASLTLTHWTYIARVVRAQILGIRHAEYIEASWLSGMNRRQIIWRHLIPAALGQAIIGLILLIPHTIWHESTLSFLGLGLPPHMPSLGTLLSDAQGAILLGHWWLLFFPCVFLIGTTVSVSIISNEIKRQITGKQELFR
ncbi:ABC transporter permease [Morganella morganii]|uniref:ABC transporter permease n=1 Tax=Morganella morganii TaxID=582 RepID=UPI00128B69A5|nr:ABC transporter permease [Morganella morganii]MQC07057.1 ABC transporter permease [Morganella morganii]MQC12358.1 ABC transporter permease [Morganella morganii]MQC15202.1 ABC transporter permease [Morganella morganii]